MEYQHSVVGGSWYYDAKKSNNQLLGGLGDIKMWERVANDHSVEGRWKINTQQLSRHQGGMEKRI